MLFADGAVFFEFETVGIVALVFEAIVVAVFAHGAFERDLHSRGFNSHLCENSIQKNYTPSVRNIRITQRKRLVNRFCAHFQRKVGKL